MTEGKTVFRVHPPAVRIEAPAIDVRRGIAWASAGRPAFMNADFSPSNPTRRPVEPKTFTAPLRARTSLASGAFRRPRFGAGGAQAIEAIGTRTPELTGYRLEGLKADADANYHGLRMFGLSDFLTT